MPRPRRKINYQQFKDLCRLVLQHSKDMRADLVQLSLTDLTWHASNLKTSNNKLEAQILLGLVTEQVRRHQSQEQDHVRN